MESIHAWTFYYGQNINKLDLFQPYGKCLKNYRQNNIIHLNAY